MRTTVVLDVVGLSAGLFESRMPRLRALFREGTVRSVRPVFPALTCPVQSTYLTGLSPRSHGIVGNGWYFKDLAQVWFWRQSNALVRGERIWDAGRRIDPRFTCANLFWWFNMYSSVDYAVTPRPLYRADGVKLPDIHSHPARLRDDLQEELGPFPLFRFWGPGASIESSRWIAEASRIVFRRHRPALTLVYIPHLDYCLQREGPQGAGVPAELAAADRLCAGLAEHFLGCGAQVVVLSEYGIGEVRGSVGINRFLRERGWLAVRKECGEDHLDAGASAAFAVADHQVAHVYVRDPARVHEVRKALGSVDGIEAVLDLSQQERLGVRHERGGDLLAVARADRWFSYAYWLDDQKAPDFARTVDIHRKPGYDPVELFTDPAIRFPRLRVARRLAARALGFRYLLDVVPLDESLVRGSHGRSDVPPEECPVFATARKDLVPPSPLPMEPTTIKEAILRHVFAPAA